MFLMLKAVLARDENKNSSVIQNTLAESEPGRDLTSADT